ncbi:MAG: response regulator [Pseudomonadota bacterium]
MNLHNKTMIRGKTNILIVDDEADVARATADWLALHNYSTHTAHAAAEALSVAEEHPIDIIISDLRMPGHDGRWLLKSFENRDIAPGFIMLTGHGDVPAAVETMQLGAEDFLEKPYEPDHLLNVVRRVEEKSRMRNELDRLKKQLAAQSPLRRFFPGDGEHNTAIVQQLSTLAQLETPLLLLGERGTSRAELAKAIHHANEERTGAAVTLRGPLLTDEDAAMSALFGGNRFADAKGALRDTEDGTLIIAEPEKMPRNVLQMLASAQRENQIQPPGFDTPLLVNSRLILWTRPEKSKAVHAAFGEQLSITSMQLAPLRERLDDLPALFAFMVAKHAPSENDVPDITPNLVNRLLEHDWPGNMRELEQVAIAHVAGLDLAIGDGSRDELDLDLRAKVHQFESQLIRATLASTAGNQSQAAKLLKIPRRTLGERMKRLGIS